MPSLKLQFIKNTCSGWSAQLSAAVIGLVMLPLNLHYLGNEVYGISVLAVSAIAMLDILSLGMGPALLRFFSQAVAKNNKEEICTISSTAQLILGSLGLLGCIIIIGCIPLFLRFYKIPSIHNHATTVLLVCLSVTFFQKFHMLVFSNIMMASHRFDLFYLNSMIASWLRMGLLLLFYKIFAPSLIWFGLAILLSNTLNYIVIIWLSFNAYGKCVFFSYAHVARKLFSTILSFSFIMLLNSALTSISIQVPVMIIGKTLGTDVLAFFFPAMAIANYLHAILDQFAVSLAPIASQDKINNNGKNLGRLAISMGQIVAHIGFFCICIAIFFMPDVVQLWLGHNFLSIAPLATVLVCGIVCGNIQSINYRLALGAATILPYVYGNAFNALLIVGGTLFGTMYWGWGLWEVCICIAVGRIVGYTFYPSWVYSKSFSYRLSRYFYEVYLRPIFTSVFVVAAFWLIRRYIVGDSASIFILGMELLIVVLIYSGALWFYGFNRETKLLLQFR
jgi:membrane protein EpsK